MTVEPTPKMTEAGKRLIPALMWFPRANPGRFVEAEMRAKAEQLVIECESEARAAALREVAEKVRALGGFYRNRGGDYLWRRQVLAILEETQGG